VSMEPLLSLPPDQFRAALAELQLDPQREADLVRQYRRASSAFAPVYGLMDRIAGQDAEAGMQRADFLPVSRPEGMSVADAVMAGEAQFAMPQSLFDLLGGVAQAADAPAAAAQGLLPAEDMPMEALGVAGAAMGGGGLAARPAGSVGMGGRVAPDARASDWIDDLRSRYPGARIDVSGGPGRGYTVSRVVVPEGARSQGLGTQIMREITDIADSQGATVALTPSGDFGGNVGRLRDFYSRLGFVGNTGRNRDLSISEEMYREPISANRSTTAGLLASATETPAQQVARLLRDGRASEVTDDLMARADPQEMYRLYTSGETGMDLPMDEANRMVRAAGQGYDISRPMYHGTDTDFTSVDTNMGSGERYRTGFFTSDNPDVAASYAPNRDLGMILPVFSRASDQGVVVDAQGANWNRIDAASPARYPNSALADEFPELVGNQNAYSYFSGMYDDLMGLRELSTNAMARERRFEGDPSITFENVIDRGPYSLTSTQAMSASQPSRVAVDFYPQNIRSRFARFDPRLSHLSNLNAANVDPITGVLAMMQAQEQQR
jgi:GNAT superfamily N-acetyltransferase